MNLDRALTIAENIRAQLAPHCDPDRCVIAGSVRRRTRCAPSRRCGSAAAQGHRFQRLHRADPAAAHPPGVAIAAVPVVD